MNKTQGCSWEGKGTGERLDTDSSNKEHKNEYFEWKIQFFSAIKTIYIIEQNKSKLNIWLW